MRAANRISLQMIQGNRINDRRTEVIRGGERCGEDPSHHGSGNNEGGCELGEHFEEVNKKELLGKGKVAWRRKS